MKFRMRNSQTLTTANFYLTWQGGWTMAEQQAATFDSVDECYKFGEKMSVSGVVEVVR
jgi:hypothetical protein